MLSVDVEIARRELTVAFAAEVADGRTLALTGPSGGGKSSVVAAIAGLAAPVRGSIGCGAQVWLDSDARVDVAPERRDCGLVFQDGALFPHLSVWRNVAYGLDGLPRRERREAALTALRAFGIDELADARVTVISGGQQRRVALARTLARGPQVLLLDEPLSALDARTLDDAARTLAEVLASRSGPSLIVTHDFSQASLLADEVAVLDKGQVVQRGSPDDLVRAPASAFVAEFTGASVLHGVGSREADGVVAVTLAGGGTVFCAGEQTGSVAVVIRPWDVTLEPAGAAGTSSARNRIPAHVTSLTPLGGRVRVGLALPEPLVAEVTSSAAARLGLEPGRAVVATWKATATRLVPRGSTPTTERTR